MILIALGANLPSESYGPPRTTLCAALAKLAARGISTIGLSSWYESAPVPPSGQPWFVNAVAEVQTNLAANVVLRALHDVEAELGRVRTGIANAPRAADLDLLDYHGAVSGKNAWPVLPHPRLAERAFVLDPLAELRPSWRHPITGESASTLREMLPGLQHCLKMPSPDSTECRSLSSTA